MYHAACLLALLTPSLLAQAAPRRISGEVVDEQFRPLAGARVAFLADRHGLSLAARTLAHTTTGVDGSFSLGVPQQPPGSRRLLPHGQICVTAAGRVSALLSAGSHRVEEFAVQPPLRRLQYPVVLPKGQAMAVRARRPDGKPLAGAVFYATSARAWAAGPWSSAGAGLPTWFSEVETDAKGAGVVFGRPGETLRVRVRAPGYFSATQPVQRAGMPWVIKLQKSGRVRGTLRSPSGEPLPATVMILPERFPFDMSRFEVLGQQMIGTDGNFDLNLDHPGRYLVLAGPDNSGIAGIGATEMGRSTLLSAPTGDLRLLGPAARGKLGGVEVCAVDAESGAPVAGVRALISWIDKAPLASLAADFRSAARPLGPKGRGVIPVPDGELGKGRVLLRAPGYQPQLEASVTWSETEPVRTTIRMQRATPLRGVVRAAKTGKPVPGALVWLNRTSNPWADEKPAPARVLADAKGRFSFTELPRGRHRLSVGPPATGHGPGQEVTLADQALDVVLTQPAPCALRGSLTDCRPATGWRLVLRATGSSHSLQHLRSIPIDAKGNFSCPDLWPGSYQLSLMVPGPGDPYLSVPLSTKLDTRQHSGDLRIGVSTLLPGDLRGTVKITGIRPEPGRLMIRLRKQTRGIVHLGMQETAHSCSVAADGSYRLRAAPGRYLAALVDLETGLALDEKRLEIVPGEQLAQDFAATLTLVRLQLEPTDPEADLVVSFLGLKVLPAEDQPAAATPDPVEDPWNAAGISLRADRREFSLLLPTGRIQVSAINCSKALLEPQHLGLGSAVVLGKTRIQPVAGKILRTRLEVRPPPKLR